MAKRGENIYKRKDGRWEGRLFSPNFAGGRRSVYGHTYREVKEKMRTHLPDGPRFCRGSIADAVWKWLASREKVLRPSSAAKYRNLAGKHILPLLGKGRVAELREENIRAFARALAEGETNGGVPLTGKTVRDVLMILEKAVKLAGGPRLRIDRGELSGVSSGRKQVTVLSAVEQTRLEQYLLQDTDEKKLGLLLCLYTGLRIGEICAMKWESINLCEKTLSVTGTMQRLQLACPSGGRRTEVTESQPKTAGACRTVPIADFLIRYLRERKPKAPDAYLLTGCDRYVEPRSYENFYKRALSASGVPENNFHTLRHTFATRCIESGADIKTVSELLGHSTVRLTLDCYVHPTMEAKKNSIRRLLVSRQRIWSENGIVGQLLAEKGVFFAE